MQPLEEFTGTSIHNKFNKNNLLHYKHQSVIYLLYSKHQLFTMLYAFVDWKILEFLNECCAKLFCVTGRRTRFQFTNCFIIHFVFNCIRSRFVYHALCAPNFKYDGIIDFLKLNISNESKRILSYTFLLAWGARVFLCDKFECVL